MMWKGCKLTFLNDQDDGEVYLKKRIDVVLKGVPSPSIGASRIIFFEYIRGLVEAGFKVRCILCISVDQKDEVEDFRKEVCMKGLISVHCIQLTKPLISTSRFSVKVDKSLSSGLRDVLKEDLADLLLVFDVSIAAIIPADYAKQKIIWVGDLGSEVNWYDGVLSIRRNFALGLFKMVSVIIRGYFWKRIYKSSLTNADRVIICSYSSMIPLRRLGIKTIFLPYPWPSMGRLDIDMQRQEPSKPTFLMYGNLKGLGWRSQWELLFSDLVPKLQDAFGKNGFKIEIGGIENAPNWLNKRIESIQEIEFHGYIPNLLEQLSKVHAVIVPLGVPVGNRSRIITALAARTPVIAHKNAAAGNPLLNHGLNCLLADNVEEFVDHMLTIVNDKKFSRLLVENAEVSYFGSYSPQNANQLFLNLVRAQLSL